ncbi:DUF4431 domain-containing protein [Salmonella enterica]|nr:DUF4431 domain-containing protein [Salmonella enterica]
MFRFDIIEIFKVQYGVVLLNQDFVVTGDVFLALISYHHTPLLLENFV